MGILGMLMGGFKALVKTTLTAVKDIVVATVRELGSSSFRVELVSENPS